MPKKNNNIIKRGENIYSLIPGTAGIIINGIFYNEKEQALIISTYKGNIHFRPLEENEQSLDLKNFEL